MLHFCADVRRSMTASRRTAPIAPDFETAFHSLSVPYPSDQLERYKTAPPINTPLLPTPPPEDPFHNIREIPLRMLGPGLDASEERKHEPWIPSHLPAFPSKHTYKDTPVLSERVTDPRRIRELATQEGKLGEEALRKLAGAQRTDTTAQQQLTASRGRGGCRMPPEQAIEALFKETMRAMMAEQTGDQGGKLELGPIVNCEKVYRMPEMPVVRKIPPDKTKHTNMESSKIKSSNSETSTAQMRIGP